MTEKFLNGARTAELWAEVKRSNASKQDKLAGAEGQLVGFDVSGSASPITIKAGDGVTVTQTGNVLTISAAGGGGLILDSIRIDTQPTKTAYKAGETFDPAGMIVKANYSNGSVVVIEGVTITGYAYDQSPLAAGTTSVTVAYTEGGVTKTAEVSVRVTKTDVAVPTASGAPVYNGQEQSAGFSGYDAAIMTAGGATRGTNAGTYTAVFALKDPDRYQWSDGTTADKSVDWAIRKATPVLLASPASLTLNPSNLTAASTITTDGDGDLSVSSSDAAVVAAVLDGVVVTASSVNQASGTAMLIVTLEEGANYEGGSVTIDVTAQFISIYGVAWDGSSTTKLTRTDDAGLFADPVPAVGTGTGSSPFDSCLPWSGMTKVTDGNNVLVKIPKYWVKVSHAPFRVQIATAPVDGYQLSPAHRDRGDGQGERDVVYIGRYECDGSYMSRSGQAPKVSTNLATFRSGIHALGAEYWQADFALQLTWWFLYIVEFADWNGQTAIGQGVVSASAKINTGATDSMTYHTGRAAGTDGQTAIQYRGIENPWGNVREWRDGIIFSDANICTYNNPANFSDSYNGAGAVVRSNKRATTGGWIKAWGCDSSDPSFIYPSEVGGSETTFVPDYCFYGAGLRALIVGGNWSNGIYAGPFYLSGNYAPSGTGGNLGSRLLIQDIVSPRSLFHTAR